VDLLIKPNSSFWAVVHFQDANDLLVGINLKKYSTSVPKIWYLINRGLPIRCREELTGEKDSKRHPKILRRYQLASYKPLQLLEAVLTRKDESWTI
jgi:hypothetical protein